MILTRLEQITLAVLCALSLLGAALIAVKHVGIRRRNAEISQRLAAVLDSTPTRPLSKGRAGDADADGGRRVNLNQADLHDLLAIKGLGKTLAERILAHRAQNGPIQSLADLSGLKGMNKKKLALLEASVVCGPAGNPTGGRDRGPGERRRLDLNTATVAELADLPAISKKMAERIIDLRMKRGRFRGFDELLDVQGVSEKTVARIAELTEIR